MQDYLDPGSRAALAHLKSSRVSQIHATGYRLGATLLAITAAALARDKDRTLSAISLLASQVVFPAQCELGLFIDESQLAFLEDLMAMTGCLEADRMAGAFQLLRSNHLIWSRVIRHDLLGECDPDARKNAFREFQTLVSENTLTTGRFVVDDASVMLTDTRYPVYYVATEQHHVSPWKSVFRLQMLTDTDVTFVRTNASDNGGILSEPGHKSRHFHAACKVQGDAHVTAQDCFDIHSRQKGSWWAH